jgi:hypothetical protein
MSRQSITNSKKKYIVFLLNLFIQISKNYSIEKKRKKKRSIVTILIVQLALSINEPSDVEEIYDVYKTRRKQ